MAEKSNLNVHLVNVSRTVISSLSFKESCFRQVGMGILDWDKNNDLARRNCSKIPDPEGKNWCMSVM